MCRLAIVVFILPYLNFGSCFINMADVECGVRSARRGRIVNGEDSIPAELPWTASIFRLGTHQCGATIINNKWLLTAGHCVCNNLHELLQPTQLSVVVGFTDLTLKGDSEPISKIVPHPKYVCNKVANDVALLKTLRQLKWTAELQPACLPPASSEDFSGNIATVAGWGFTHENIDEASRPDILQKTEVLIFSNEKCSQWYKSVGEKINLYTSQMCAGHEDGGRDACWADSGGPLTIRGDEGRTVIVGVISTGVGCARPKTLGIYTRVSTYTDWIVNNINGENIKSARMWYPRSG